VKTHAIGTLALSVFVFSAGAMAETMSKTEYASAVKEIRAEYKSNRESCKLYAQSKYKRSCIAEANSTRKAEEAELAAHYKLSSGPDLATAKGK